MAINGSAIDRVTINAQDTIKLIDSFAVTSTSTSTIVKQALKYLSVISSSTSSIKKAISKIFSTISEMSVVVLTESAFHLVLLSVTEASVITIKKAISITKTITSTSTSSITKLVNSI